MIKFFPQLYRFVLITIAFVISAQAIAQLNLTEKLPLDPKVKMGKLENGLTYYIRENNKPEQHVELRLVLNAGSINEDDDQSGLAHMCEHMAFNGTTHFKKNEIVSFLQDIGVSFGNDLNAQTSFDETIYILPIPTGKPDNLEKGFQVLEDWAHNVTYLTEDIEGERAIILEESRRGKGSFDRMFQKYFPKVFEGSKYAVRLPIGKDSLIKNFSPDVIRRFYHDWYRPDLMAVVVVGDITTAAAEELIKKHFAGLHNPASERPRENAIVYPYKESSAMVLTDKEATSTSIILIYPSEKSEASATVKNFRDDQVEQLFSTMLNLRLQELTQKANPPFIGAGGGFNGLVRGYKSFIVNISAGTNDPINALRAAAQEVERVKKYGFTASELDRVKKVVLASYERAYNNRDKNESENYVEEYINHFLEQEPSPGIEKEYEYIKAILPSISIDEINALSGKLKAQQNYFAVMTGPEAKAGEKSATEEELKQTIAAAEKADLKPYEEKTVAASLLKTIPKSGKVISSVINKTTGTTELKLSNGVMVTLKPTDFKNDQVLMGAKRAGGKNNYGLKDKYNAEYAVQVVNSMGVGDFSPTDLKKALAGKTASVSPQFGYTFEGVRGNSSVKDMETMFQLLYLNMTSPRMDTTLSKSFIQRNKSQYAMLGANPQAAFVDTLYKTFYNKNVLAPVFVPNSTYFDKINVSRAVEIYKERFGNVSGMNFVFVGSFKTEQIIPLIEKYVASLPSVPKKFTYADNKVRPIAGNKKLLINKGKEQKSLIVQIFTGEVPYSDDLDLKAQALTGALNIRVIEELREKIQGIYSGGISGGLQKLPYAHFQFITQLPCGPEKADTLLKAMRIEINKLIKNGPSEENLKKVKQQWLEDHKKAKEENEEWLEVLLDNKFPGSNINYFLKYENYVKKITTKDVQKAAALMLIEKNTFTGLLMPEK